MPKPNLSKAACEAIIDASINWTGQNEEDYPELKKIRTLAGAMLNNLKTDSEKEKILYEFVIPVPIVVLATDHAEALRLCLENIQIEAETTCADLERNKQKILKYIKIINDINDLSDAGWCKGIPYSNEIVVNSVDQILFKRMDSNG